MLTNERADLLTQYLVANPERARELLVLDPREAIVKINADGHDFTVEELAEFGEQAKAAAATEGELNEDALGNVAGGYVNPRYFLIGGPIINPIRNIKIW